MESNTSLVRTFLRVISLQGRAVVESLFTGQFSLVSSGAGKVVSTNVGGKAFSFAADASLNTSSILVIADEALRLWDSMDATARAAYFTSRPIRTARATF